LDFGKLSNISGVDFSLPVDLAGNAPLLNRLGASGQKPQVYVGAPVWSQKEWVGRIYPMGTRASDYLKYYSQQFNAIELNTTHYRIPDDETIKSWTSTSEPGFKFCPKILQVISHEKMLQNAEELTEAFCKSVMGLGDRLGRSFLQLPPQFSPAHLPALRNFLETLPRGFRLAIEFRHPAWFSKGVLRSDTARLLEIYGAVALITDVAGRRDVLHMTLTAPAVMVRFVGNSLHSTDYSRINSWIGRLKDWMSQGMREIYFFIHEPDNVQAPELIQYFIQEINMRCGLELKPWVEMNQGSQMSLFG
jgi:uncharacterized protein YecE (DUF72 family)